LGGKVPRRKGFSLIKANNKGGNVNSKKNKNSDEAPKDLNVRN
jgi:hypothetical protein